MFGLFCLSDGPAAALRSRAFRGEAGIKRRLFAAGWKEGDGDDYGRGEPGAAALGMGKVTARGGLAREIPGATRGNGMAMSLMPISFCFAVSRREKMKAGCSIVDKPEGGGGKEV